MASLLTIPPELCNMIVGHLAPDEETRFTPGSKSDLQNTNLACKALHTWVPKYLFRDMVLIIVDFQHVPKLLRFAEEKEDLAKLVLNVQVQIPPGIRWEIGMGDADSVRDSTAERLLSHFGAFGLADLTMEQRDFCDRYHEALVWPFFKADWFLLINHALAVSGETLKLLSNLEYVEAGICERENLPWPTMTQRFIKKHGADIVNAASPQYEISRIPNIACLSSVLLRTVPRHVNELRVSAANLGDLREWATINRLLTFSYQLADPPIPDTNCIHHLTLDIRGAAGIQRQNQAGGAAPSNEIGSPSMAKYWSNVMTHLPGLKHLRLNGHWSQGPDTHAASPTRLHRLPRSCLLSLLLPEIGPNFESLYLHDFCVEHSTLEKFVSKSPNELKRLVLSNVTLKCSEEKPWEDLLLALAAQAPGMEVDVVAPFYLWASASWTKGKRRLVKNLAAQCPIRSLPEDASSK